MDDDDNNNNNIDLPRSGMGAWTGGDKWRVVVNAVMTRWVS